jgi:hypothetical protein
MCPMCRMSAAVAKRITCGRFACEEAWLIEDLLIHARDERELWELQRAVERAADKRRVY